jgi:polysaccharide biosynthesis protein PslH
MSYVVAGTQTSRQPSRVLYISYTSPVPAKIGPSRRHFHILGQLLRFYDVQVLSLGTKTESDLFGKEFGDKVIKFGYAKAQGSFAVKLFRKCWLNLTLRCDWLPSRNRSLRELCRSVTAEGRFDAIILSGCLLNRLPLPRGIPIVADTHNVESEVLARTATFADTFVRRLHARFQRPSTFREERRCALKADLLLATSECDKAKFERIMNVRNVAVVPNGVDVAEFYPREIPGEPGEILFTGLMSYYPNQQAIRWFLDFVFPKIQQALPSVRLTVAGANPPRWLLARRSAQVRVTGAVPDMRPYFQRASVVIVPLMIGGGTRVKILEAQAMARPVISTALGAEGLNVTSASIVLADDGDAFASNAVRLLTDATFALNVATEGRRLVEREYSWDRIGDRLEAILAERIGLIAKDCAMSANHLGHQTHELYKNASHAPKMHTRDVSGHSH